MELHEHPWASGSDLEPFAVHDPADGGEIVRVRPHSTAEIDAAVAAAARAQAVWAARPPMERAAALRAAADHLRAHVDELTRLETRENGKPLDQARGDVFACIGLFDFFAGAITAEHGQARSTPFSLDTTALVPYGVVGAIIPFNWPPIHTAGKLAPALAVGNAVVLKPGEQAPLTPTRICALVAEVLPDEVVAVVHGGVEQGRHLAGHPGIGKVAFTGSPGAGRDVIRAAAARHTPTLMELGGKNCLIVCEDADLPSAVAWAVEGAFFNQGEACTAASRILVHSSVHAEFMAAFNAATSALVVGPGSLPGTHVGPLITAAHRQRVLDHIAAGAAEGAEITARSPLPDDPAYAGGYWVAPTVFDGVTRDMRVAREEIFGPVTAVLRFEDDEEAVDIANDTEFGLIAGVFSRDVSRAMAICSRLEVGMTLVNNYNRALIGSPFGGVKASGYGREHTLRTLDEYGYTRLLRIPSGGVPVPRWQAVEGLAG
ncbi:aldehyde dehydrogenase family protein [Streptomyces sp. SHP 1-2]|uniref:aldehyde dehydrogenase family protein n=1 Tax=Streptomyces sp. SHP 1-2 TaxID=2769489 RepID=UPI0022376046|nr:aldehyde dehydrogenase family protein [Streptomyces sp. SHP 1-2]MCW5253181.1 aldehyde dehydrogenase [Streptomyces sp. SHP 1-2]